MVGRRGADVVPHPLQRRQDRRRRGEQRVAGVRPSVRRDRRLHVADRQVGVGHDRAHVGQDRSEVHPVRPSPGAPGVDLGGRPEALVQQHVAVHHDGDRLRLVGGLRRGRRRRGRLGRRPTGPERSAARPTRIRRACSSVRPGNRRRRPTSTRPSNPPNRPATAATVAMTMPARTRAPRVFIPPARLDRRSAQHATQTPSIPRRLTVACTDRRVGAGSGTRRETRRRAEVIAMAVRTHPGSGSLARATSTPYAGCSSRTRSRTSSSITGSASPGWSRAGSAARSGATRRATSWSRSAMPLPTSPRCSGDAGVARRLRRSRPRPGPAMRLDHRRPSRTSGTCGGSSAPSGVPRARSGRVSRSWCWTTRRRWRRPRTYAGCVPTSSTSSTRRAWRCTPRSSASRPRPTAAPSSTGRGSPS